MKYFQVITKPVGDKCNILCTYCFYTNKNEEPVIQGKKNCFHMDDETLHAYVKSYIEDNGSQEVEFIWQGGEPTLAGVSFYEKVISLQKKYGGEKIIKNSIQTNGVLIDEVWAFFLKKNNFMVGISIDGPKYLHDEYRKNTANNSVFKKVVNAINLLNKHDIKFNVLTVVNKKNVNHPIETYDFLTKELGVKHIQFIPLVDVKQSKIDGRNESAPWSITGDEFGRFTNAVFDKWISIDVGNVYIQFFENIFAGWLGVKPSLCTMQSTCGKGLVVERNGAIYCCDHYVDPEHLLGNIKESRLSKIVKSKQHQLFGMKKAALTKKCQACEFKFLCHGGCPKHRFKNSTQQWENHLCSGYKAIFTHVQPFMVRMVHLVESGKPPSRIMLDIKHHI